MKFCKDCWNFSRCNAEGRTVDFAVDDGVCREFDEVKNMTNADRFRAMNDKELAHELALVAGWDREQYKKAKSIGIEKIILDILRQPCEED